MAFVGHGFRLGDVKKRWVFHGFGVLGGGPERKLWLLDGVGANIGLNIGRKSAKLGGSWANIRLRWGLRCANVGPTWANRAQHKANIGQVGGSWANIKLRWGLRCANIGLTWAKLRATWVDMGQ